MSNKPTPEPKAPVPAVCPVDELADLREEKAAAREESMSQHPSNQPASVDYVDAFQALQEDIQVLRSDLSFLTAEFGVLLKSLDSPSRISVPTPLVYVETQSSGAWQVVPALILDPAHTWGSGKPLALQVFPLEGLSYVQHHEKYDEAKHGEDRQGKWFR